MVSCIYKIGNCSSFSFYYVMLKFSLVLKSECFQSVFPSVLEGKGKESKPFQLLQFQQ